MPRFMGLVLGWEEGIGVPPQSLFDAMDVFIGERAANGSFVDGGGRVGTEDAVNFVVRRGEVTRVHGPYAEGKEVVGGWSLMEYASLEEAVADQRLFAELHAKHWPEVTVVSTLRLRCPRARRLPATDAGSLRWPRAGRDVRRSLGALGAFRGRDRHVAGRVGPPRSWCFRPDDA